MLRRVLVLVTAMVTAVLVASGVAVASIHLHECPKDGSICYGGISEDIIWGTRWADSIYGQQGADTISAKGGDDFISGGSNYDPYNPDVDREEHLYGEGGNDHIFGDEGRDYLSGGVGNDQLSLGLETPGEDADRAEGDSGYDRIREGLDPPPEDLNNITQPQSTDVLVGGDVGDYILANTGAWSVVSGGMGSDLIEANGDYATDTIKCGEDPDGQDVDTVYYDGSGAWKPDVVSADCEELVEYSKVAPPPPPPLPPPLP